MISTGREWLHRVGLSRSLGIEGGRWPRPTANGFTGWKVVIRCFLRWSAEVAGNGGQQCGARVVK
jgi:hypothetical protein